MTSRRTGRWIFPKGGADPGEAPGDAAVREAFEEAGVKGRPGPAPLGRYAALKVSGTESRLLSVELWPVEITELVDDYPEAGVRQRRLTGLNAALALLDQDDMRRLLMDFDRRGR